MARCPPAIKRRHDMPGDRPVLKPVTTENGQPWERFPAARLTETRIRDPGIDHARINGNDAAIAPGRTGGGFGLVPKGTGDKRGW